MSPYIENDTQRACTAGQVPATPTLIEWLAIMGARAMNIWVEPGDWVVRFSDSEIVPVGAAYFVTHYTAV